MGAVRVVREGIGLFHFDNAFFRSFSALLEVSLCAPVLKWRTFCSDFILLHEDRIDNVNKTKKQSSKVKFPCLADIPSFPLLQAEVY